MPLNVSMPNDAIRPTVTFSAYPSPSAAILEAVKVWYFSLYLPPMSIKVVFFIQHQKIPPYFFYKAEVCPCLPVYGLSYIAMRNKKTRLYLAISVTLLGDILHYRLILIHPIICLTALCTPGIHAYLCSLWCVSRSAVSSKPHLWCILWSWLWHISSPIQGCVTDSTFLITPLRHLLTL